MGETGESYGSALEVEINRWSGFVRALRKPEREAFGDLMNVCRAFASGNDCVSSPLMFEPMVMSLLLAQQVRINQLEKALNAMAPESSSSPASQSEPESKALKRFSGLDEYG